MQQADAAGTSLRPRFPALDPEPPPRPWRRAASVLVVIVVVLAGVLGYTALRQRHHNAGASAGQPAQGSPFTGLILALTPSGVLSLTDVRTGRVVLLKKLGEFPANPPPSVSPDGKYFVSPAMGALLSLVVPAQPAVVRNSLTFPAYTNLSLPDPFSNHDASMLIQGTQANYQTAFSPYAVQSVQTGRTASLGIADSAAGDPAAPGAFVSYVHPSRVTPPRGVHPDIGIELRDAGAAVRVIATAAMIDHVLGITPRYGVRLVPYPNPQGTMVAVAVQPIGDYGTGGVVVYSRAGKMLGFQTVDPSGARAITWSPSGTTLAFVGQGDNSADFTDWEVGGGSSTSVMPASLGQIDECVWSPDSLSVLCGGGPTGSWWIVQSGTTYALAGHGQVLAWLGGRLTG